MWSLIECISQWSLSLGIGINICIEGVNQWEAKGERLIQEQNVLGNVSPIDSPNGGFTNIYSDMEIRNWIFSIFFWVAIYAIYFYVFLQGSLPNVTKHPATSCDRDSWRSTSKRWRRQYPMDTPAVAPPQPNPWSSMARYDYYMLLSLLGAKQGHPKDSNVWLKINSTRLIETCWHH